MPLVLRGQAVAHAAPRQVHAGTRVYAGSSTLVRWVRLPVQLPERLEDNEGIQASPCGERLLQRLQSGSRPRALVEELLCEHLAQTSPERITAYRRYREESCEQMTAQKLRAWHWETLYGYETLDESVVVTRAHVHYRFDRKGLRGRRSRRQRSRRHHLHAVARRHTTKS